MSAMLKSGKELKVFTVNEENLKQFAKEAKRYGVVYCALKGKGKSSDGMVDIMVRAEDASKINRIVERFKLATVDTVSIKNEIVKSKAEKNTDMSVSEHERPDKSADDKQLDEALKAPIKKEEQTNENPSAARTDKSLPFEPTSEKPISSEEGTFKSAESKPSVRKELNAIRESRSQRDIAENSGKSKNQQKTVSQNKPKNNKKKKAKER